MKSLLALSALWAACSVVAPCQAQTWPNKPVRVIVNFPPGGAADQLARIVAQPLQDALGQPFVIENRAGAGGNLGGDAAAKSQPDGYTLLMSSGGMVSINPHLYSKMPFNPAKDLVPVAAVARVPFYLVVPANSPVKDFKGLVYDMKANPGKRTFGSPGNGSSPHLAAEMLKSQAGVFALHVPYRGAAPALNDLLAGQLDFLFDPGIAIPHVKAGKLRMLAIASPQRSPLFPDVPTLDELGLKRFDADAVFGLYAPAGTPSAVVRRLNSEINRALGTPSVKDRIIALGNVPSPMTPENFGEKSDEDFKRYGAIIRERHITAD